MSVVEGDLRESAAFVDGPDGSLFALLTVPRVDTDVAVIVCSGGPKGTASIGRNRMFARLCRGLAADGVAAVRFDYHGTGESSGDLPDVIGLDTPFTGDVAAIAHWLRDVGYRRIVLVGSCFGSRTALASAELVDDLVGLVLISPPLRQMRQGEHNATRLVDKLSTWQMVRRGARLDVLKGLADPRRRNAYRRVARVKAETVKGSVLARGEQRSDPTPWLHPSVVRSVREVVDRAVPVQFLYGDDERFYREFLEARSGRLGAVIDPAAPLVTVTTVPGTVHGFSHLSAQDDTLEAVRAWVGERFHRPEAAG